MDNHLEVDGVSLILLLAGLKALQYMAVMGLAGTNILC